jgi:hypothetical protein
MIFCTLPIDRSHNNPIKVDQSFHGIWLATQAVSTYLRGISKPELKLPFLALSVAQAWNYPWNGPVHVADNLDHTSTCFYFRAQCMCLSRL